MDSQKIEFWTNEIDFLSYGGKINLYLNKSFTHSFFLRVPLGI